MQPNARNAYFTRSRVLKALSDDEIASVSTAETADRLDNGDEYLDLEHLELGVRQANPAGTPMGRVLPRKAVHAKTWSKLLARIDAFPGENS
ncbi:MAG: hypothetical protein JWP97_1731 [Labilithrix sp.]|nr:hypothetical protein [Labilithrix sp.]